MDKPICCICFYGATRTLPQNLESINKVINQFRELYDVKIIVHTWNDNKDFKLLNPNYYRTTNQEELRNKLPFEKIEKNTKEFLTTIFPNNPTKINQVFQDTKKFLPGVLFGTYSLKQVTTLTLSKFPNANLYVIMRPDTRFVRFDLKPILKHINYKSSQLQVITPDFDTGKRSSNDRFAICYGSEAFRLIGTRYDLLEESSKDRFFFGENVLQYTIDKYKIKNIRGDMCFLLVRPNGKIAGWCN